VLREIPNSCWTIELEDMTSKDPKFNSSTKKRFICFDLMGGKDARKTERGESILVTRAKVLIPC